MFVQYQSLAFVLLSFSDLVGGSNHGIEVCWSDL